MCSFYDSPPLLHLLPELWKVGGVEVDPTVLDRYDVLLLLVQLLNIHPLLLLDHLLGLGLSELPLLFSVQVVLFVMFIVP